MVEWILAYALLTKVDTSAPQMIAPMPSRSACLAEAEKRNRTDERLREKAVRAAGGEFVCLHIVRVTV